MPIAFQVDAFQDGYPSNLTAFQSFDRYVTIRGVSLHPFLILELGPFMQEYRAGNAVVITCNIYDPSQFPARLFSPDSVLGSLYDPSGSPTGLVFAELSTGVFTSTVQTGIGDPRGAYSVEVQAISGVYAAKTIRQGAFKLV